MHTDHEADWRIEAMERQFDRTFTELKHTHSLLEHRYRTALENGRIVAEMMTSNSQVLMKIAEKPLAQEFTANVCDHLVSDFQRAAAHLDEFMVISIGTKRTLPSTDFPERETKVLKLH